MINKDTLIFGSFAKNAGNNGCYMFNSIFKYYNINAVYKSFSVNNIEHAVTAAKTLNFKGFGITMPFKQEVLKYVDELSEDVIKIGSANTVLNNNGILKAYNTDYLSAKEYLNDFKNKKLFILGDGGFSQAVQYAAKELKIDFAVIKRNKWNTIIEIKNSLIFNCTPVSNIEIDNSNIFIDCLINTDTGQKLSFVQASYQFNLYTGIDRKKFIKL